MKKREFMETVESRGFDYAMFELMVANFRTLWTKEEIIECARHYINERDDLVIGEHILATVAKNLRGLPIFYYDNIDEMSEIVVIYEPKDIPDVLFED